MFLLYMLGFILMILALPPLLRWVLARRRLSRLEKQCLQKGYRFLKGNKRWFLGTGYGDRADFAIETETCVYAVKLFGFPRKHTVMVLLHRQQYFLRHIFGILLELRLHIDHNPRTLQPYDFDCFCGTEEKAVRPMLLLHPAPLKVVQQDLDRKERGFYYGDSFCGIEIVTVEEIQNLLQ